MTLTLDIIEQRAKALGWPTRRSSLMGVARLTIAADDNPHACVSYYAQDGVVTRLHGHSACRHDLAALESPEPARPVVDPVAGLLPCPFCGSPAEVVQKTPGYKARCTSCDAGRSIRRTPDEARAAWNRRTP